MKRDCQYFTLPNGLRVVALHRPGAVAGHCGVIVNAGSRDEDDSHFGLAHFVEHTIFKGTSHRRAWHILNRMETVGGELNAYTTKEETVVYTTFPSGNLSRAVDLIADLVCSSIFPSRELNKEREVVADEIDTYLDIPSEGIYDDFDELIFAGSELAHSILGTRQSLVRLDSAACRCWLDRYYTPSRMVLFYSGSDSYSHLLQVAGKAFAPLRSASESHSRIRPTTLPLFEQEINKGTHQAHTLMGARTVSIMAEERFALSLLTNIVGGPGMNSLLNVALREKRGLVYTIDASTSLMTDCGLFTIYFGCDPDDTKKCVRLVNETMHRLASSPLTSRRLDAAKRQYLGQITVGSTNSEQEALSIARATLHSGRALTRNEVEDAIRSVTAEQLRAIAEQLQLSRLTII
ncbi:MAG: insulinase family protein [Duncaniella sp.]|nr:insulinase family protein [Duncaniella sp.]